VSNTMKNKMGLLVRARWVALMACAIALMASGSALAASTPTYISGYNNENNANSPNWAAPNADVPANCTLLIVVGHHVTNRDITITLAGSTLVPLGPGSYGTAGLYGNAANNEKIKLYYAINPGTGVRAVNWTTAGGNYRGKVAAIYYFSGAGLSALNVNQAVVAVQQADPLSAVPFSLNVVSGANRYLISAITVGLGGNFNDGDMDNVTAGNFNGAGTHTELYNRYPNLAGFNYLTSSGVVSSNMTAAPRPNWNGFTNEGTVTNLAAALVIRPTWDITGSSGGNGTVTADTGFVAVADASAVTYTITPDSGYIIASLTLNGNAQTITNAGGQTVVVNPVKANQNLVATFVINNAPTDISPDSVNLNDDAANTEAVTTLTVTDADGPATYTWTELPGGDAAAFSMSATTGATKTVRVENENLIDRANGPTMTYNVRVADGAGAFRDETITFNIADATPPTISLNTPGTQFVQCSTPYVEDGATYIDNFDPTSATPVVNITGSVNVSTPGSYTINYNANDGAGNAAVQVQRTVIVQDTTLPVILLNGSPSVTVPCGGVYNDDGASVSDTCDLGLTTVNTNNPVNPLIPNVYTVTYTATDVNGNAAIPVTRTVTVQDAVDPILNNTTPTDSTDCVTPYSELFARSGVSASDACDPAVDDTDVVITIGGNPAVFPITSVGTFVLDYTVTDSSGNSSTDSRTVTVDDTGVPPVISSPGTATHECGTAWVSPVTATDDCDVSVIPVESGTFNPNQPGTYNLTYNATDGAGNAATPETLVVTVEDITIPVITNGSAPITIECHTAFVDPVSVADTCDSSVAVVTTGSVDVDTPGTYNLTYDASDDSGNDAVQVARVVTVEDTTDPVIALVGGPIVNHECGTAYTDDGTTLTEACDQSLTVSVAGGPVNASTPVGSTFLTFTAVDAEGNAATPVVREVVTADTVAPVISLVGGSVTLGPLATYSEQGANVVEACDTGLTVTIDASQVQAPPTLGSWTVFYTAIDSSGNAAIPVQRSVTRVPNNPPVLSFGLGQGTANVTIQCSVGTYTELGATATDPEDGNIPVLPGDIGGDVVDVTTPGIYVVTYDVVDSGGVPASTLTRTVTVEDTTPPTITRQGNATEFVLLNGPVYVDADGATALDVCGNTDLTSSIVPTILPGGVVDVTNAGTYTITYNVSDGAGNAAAPVSRTVIVAADATPPVITLTGGDSVVVDCGDGYTEQGYSALDNVAPFNLTGSVLVVGSVPVNALPGVYTITYSVSDAAGNNAVKIRTVTVSNNCPLTVTIVNGTSREVQDGESVTFDTTVTGAIGAPDLQWFFDDGSKALVALSGETNPDLTIDPVTTAEVGDYYLEASDDVTTTQSPIISLSIGNGIPVGGLLGFCALSAAMALGGAASLRRRK